MMHIHQQIKHHRERLGLTQDMLAERLYVSRQTISNWETGRSYPDLENLLRLSILFDTSLDELVKGDVDVMKQELDTVRSNRLAVVMTVLLGLTAISAGPSIMILGWWGAVIPIALAAGATYAGIRVEQWKARHQLQTYSEIVAFQKQQTLTDDEKRQNWIKDRLVFVAAMSLFLLGGIGLTLLGFWLVK
ncbi:helix-turn-helix transcriptional regulator [Secundilactobacillus similis DSM 23365 = JCM 2765]|nr:helix-turn-helix transcriptional regulator [Secundilactobacillus similis]